MKFKSFNDNVNFMHFHDIFIPHSRTCNTNNYIHATNAYAWLLHFHKTKYLAQRYTV